MSVESNELKCAGIQDLRDLPTAIRRNVAIITTVELLTRVFVFTPSGLPIRDTADCQSALRSWGITRIVSRSVQFLTLLLILTLISGCRTPSSPKTGTLLQRHGDEIVVAGQFFHTGTPIVLWMDSGGYDAYRVERRFSPFDESSWETSKVAVAGLTTPNRYGLRQAPLTPEQIEKVRGGGWDLPLLQSVVDQFVLHFDACGVGRQCFNVLHDHRDLSVHFMLDIDGTIYQTLDLKERAWHATTSNTRSVGVEIANIGAYKPGSKNPLQTWYGPGSNGTTRITIPASLGDGGVRTLGFIGYPIRYQPVVGTIQGTELEQYDLTPQQYDALIKLTATLCSVFPKMKCDYPKDADGGLIREKLPDDQLNQFQGVLGHYHIQKDKVDPGPALQWDYLIESARKLVR